ncbi:MAG: hypothetical protein JNK60_08590 [Acidobacteria bacterium]|nr:hypothetical protein [Acidobacteriota bacterium]
MPFRLGKAFSPSYKLLKPLEQAGGLALQLAEWDSAALVEITNEPGKKFKVGFVQVLFDNEVVATYKSHILTVSCAPLPVLDSDPGMLPFYEADVAYSPEVDGAVGTVRAEAKIYDSPEDPFDWYKAPGTANPLINVRYRLKFKTWLVVRDITGPLTQSFAAVLTQFNYVLEAGFNVDVTRPLGSRCGFATGSEKPNKPDLVSPTTPIHACVWKDVVANDCLSETWKDRALVVSSTAPIGAPNTGVNVKNIAQSVFNKG